MTSFQVEKIELSDSWVTLSSDQKLVKKLADKFNVVITSEVRVKNNKRERGENSRGGDRRGRGGYQNKTQETEFVPSFPSEKNQDYQRGGGGQRQVSEDPMPSTQHIMVAGTKEDVEKAIVGISKNLKKYVCIMVSTPFMAEQKFKDFVDIKKKIQKDYNVKIARGLKASHNFVIGKPENVEEAKQAILQFVDPKAGQVTSVIDIGSPEISRIVRNNKRAIGDIQR